MTKLHRKFTAIWIVRELYRLIYWASPSSTHSRGKDTYRLHLPPNIPVKDFWSAIVYDIQTRSMIQTEQQFPSVGSQNKDLLVNKDGLVDVYFGPRAPVGKENN
jgi:hypothetical protein